MGIFKPKDYIAEDVKITTNSFNDIMSKLKPIQNIQQIPTPNEVITEFNYPNAPELCCIGLKGGKSKRITFWKNKTNHSTKRKYHRFLRKKSRRI